MGKRNNHRSSANGTKALKMVKTLIKAQEVKNNDVEISDATLARAGAVFDMTPIAQGDTSTTRDGDKIWIKRVTFNWNCFAGIASSGVNASGHIRVIVVKLLDNQVQGVGPAVTDILVSATIASLWNKESSLKYQVLYDKHRYVSGPIGSIQATGGQQSQLLLKQKLSLGKGYVRDVQQSGAIESNGLFMIALHSYEDEDLTFTANVRVSYTDS